MNNTRMYLIFTIITFIIAFILGGYYFYGSAFSLPAMEKSLSGNMSQEELVNLYLELRSPHLFAGYERFDNRGKTVVKILEYFDNAVLNHQPLAPTSSRYLTVLKKRYGQGVHLTGVTAIYVLTISLMSFFFFLFERRRVGSQ